MTADRITTPFTRESTDDEVLDGLDLTGKRIVITGGGSGVGAESARALAARGAEVTIAVRDTAFGDSAAERIRARRRFLTEVGTGPKTLQRTLRFQGYLALAQAADHGSRVADLAAEVGYADHAHLARECLRLTGLTPRELLGDAADRCGCGHDHAASYGPFLARRPLVSAPR